MCDNPKLHLVSIKAAFFMHIQYLVKFCQSVLKILSGNKIMTDGGNDAGTDVRNVETIQIHYSPTFSKQGYNDAVAFSGYNN